FSFGYLPFARVDEIFPPAPAMTFLQQQDPEVGRVVNLGAYPINAEMAYGLNGVGGWEITLARVSNLLNDFSKTKLDGLTILTKHVLHWSDRRLDLMNAEYFVTTAYDNNYDLAAADSQRFKLVFSDMHTRVFENKRALARAWFVPAGKDAIEVLPTESA